MKFGKTWHPSNLIIVTNLSLTGLLTFSIVSSAIAEQACVRTTTGNVICGTIMPQSASQDSSIQRQRVEKNGLRFELQNCVRNGDAVDCNLIITNIGQKNRDLKLYSSQASGTGRSPSRAISNSGDEFSTTIYELGNERTTSSWRVRKTLVPDVPMKAKFTFNDVTSQTNQLALIEIGFGVLDPGTISTNFSGSTAQFRNVVIQSR
ncbi:hypothetical protein ACE1B6_20105 [Aerosakkonemataceae cyanobacterium BLCC-F154]|uniref:DUF11 domain-containing protein n=1 Tax=Floridaenema fluviatile BLCC-F154 TaxID=3153640 RepID=A0ABV4YHG6_9CYAN